jgi:hypothetical protein
MVLDRAPHRAFMRAMGLDDEALARPMIGVAQHEGRTDAPQHDPRFPG